MRETIGLQSDWWVSPSAGDARLAAAGDGFSVADLELASEPDNHPRRLSLREAVGTCGWRDLPRQGETKPETPSGYAHGSPPSTPPKPRRVPTQWLTYARRLAIPAGWAGQRVFLNLDNVRYHVTAWINDRQVAHYRGGLEPHRLDITDAVTPGGTALLTLTVGDSGVSALRPFDTSNYTGTRLPTCKEIENNLVHPVVYGGADRAVGQVSVETAPAVRTEYVFADPRVSAGELRFHVCLANDSDRPRRVRVCSEALDGRPLLHRRVQLPPRSTQTVQRNVAWPDAIRWDLDNPHLYTVVTVIEEDGAVLDTHTDSFGFREFTVNGHSFYLNGRKIHLHGQSGHTSPDTDWMSLDEKIAYLRAWKERGHITHFRLHARPQHREWVVAADRVGLLVTTETALWTTGYHSFDWVGSEEACAGNVCNHFLEALVRRDRNNPSVVIWSLSNEMSPITPFDLENPKMAALTRVLLRAIAAARAEDGSRFIQMSSAMDFLGHLELYNLHYPKNWQAFPDYPHTAYWLDGAFLFPWYGPRRAELPSWSWRQDKPLLFGEFTCVYGATPDNQAAIIGDVAFERADFGTPLVHEKLWPLEIKAYRRRDVSGFCAWAAMFHEPRDIEALFARGDVRAHSHALRPLAVLDHSYHTDCFAGDEVAIELSIHNDTRQDVPLEMTAEAWCEGRLVGGDRMPRAVYGPAENRAFTNRFRAPQVTTPSTIEYRVSLRSGDREVDAWSRPFRVWPRGADMTLPAGTAFYDPDGAIAAALTRRGVSGGLACRTPAELTAARDLKTVWISFGLGRATGRDWAELRRWIAEFANRGGLVVLDHAPDGILQHLPSPLKNGRGYGPDERMEITYAYNIAPQHPIMEGLADAYFSLWGADYYVARRTCEVPQEGNVIPLLAAGTDRQGLTSSPLLEMRVGRGAVLVNTLELLEKLGEAPTLARLVGAVCGYCPERRVPSSAVCATADTLRVLGEVGLRPAGTVAARVVETPTAALEAEVALIDGMRLPAADFMAVGKTLARGGTVCLHALSIEQTRALLDTLGLPGEVVDGQAQPREWDTFRHTHALANGMTNNYLYWIVNKANVAPWTLAPLDSRPATALIRLPEGAHGAWSLTRHGAVTVYTVGAGTLVVDNLRWERPDFDEPERPRRYVARLLTHLGIPLGGATGSREGTDFETEAERRERGHF